MIVWGGPITENATILLRIDVATRQFIPTFHGGLSDYMPTEAAKRSGPGLPHRNTASTSVGIRLVESGSRKAEVDIENILPVQ